jgi:hypothetical protein
MHLLLARPSASVAMRPPRQACCLTRAPRLTITKARAAAPTTTAAAAASVAADTAAAFCRTVEGEWEGVTATFNPAGDALDLPERFVPQAFRDWDMVPKDWQSQCSVPPPEQAAGGGGLPLLRFASRRMMPTVGCEADAVAFTDEMTVIGGANSTATATPQQVLAAVAADGAYASAPSRLPADGRATVRLEACLPLPPASADASKRPERLRVVQTFTRDWTIRLENEGGSEASAASSPPPSPAALLRLESVELHREQREGGYTGRVELLGCGGGSPPISGLEHVSRSSVPSSVMADLAAASSSSAPPATAPPGSLASGAVLTLLPLGAWSCVSRGEGGGASSLRAEAGVVVGGRRRVVAFEFGEDGALSGASISEEDV